MAVSFAEYLSGEPAAYDALYQNMKCGLNAGKELSEFLRERSCIEETNSKLLAKVAKQANGGAGQGTFAPVWAVFRGSAEKLSALHQHAAQKIGDLVKDVGRYAEDLHKRHRSVKESEAGTLEAAIAAQSAKQALQKARDLEAAKTAEVERLRRDGAPPKDLEKAEAKLRKLRDDRDALADKHDQIKRDFDKRMALTCKHFQDVEETHLKQMKQFVNAYAELVRHNHDLVGQVHVDFKRQFSELTVERLLERFALEKYGSLEKKSAAEQTAESERAPVNGHRAAPKKEPSFAQKTSRRTTSLLNLFAPGFQSKDDASAADGAAPCSAPSSPSGDQSNAAADKSEDARMGRNPLRESRWFLRSKRTKAKAKKAKKKKEREEADEPPNVPDEGSELDEKEEEEAPSQSLSRDADSTRSPEVDEDGYRVRPTDVGGGASTTDSDSDEDRERDRKIRVEIKPLDGVGAASASVDELVATVQELSLFPSGTARRGSNARPGGDPLGLSLLASPPPLGSSRSLFKGSRDSPTQDGDPPSETGSIERKAATPSTAIPRPPSRRSEPGEFRSAGVTASRGPSPLTIGMADTIPLAVAFHEIVHAYFKGADEEECRVKMSGDMMLSFPTGIVGVLANNPNPARLRFRLKNADRLEGALPNARLVGRAPDGCLEFDMGALTSLLKSQAEKNPGAAYFNVDILKYQIKPEPGASSCPLQLVAYWKRERTHTDLKMDYKYNSRAMSSPSPLLNLSVSVPMDGGVGDVTSRPSCRVDNSGESANLVWKFTELSQHSDGRGIGSLKARAELSSGPSAKATASAQFNCEGATLSGIEFELVGAGYRLSLVKRRFVSGKYICDGD